MPCTAPPGPAPEDAAALSGLAGEPLVDLRYRADGTDVMLRAAELAPFLVCQYGAKRQLLPGSAVALLAEDVIERLNPCRLLGAEPDLTGSLAATLLAAAGRDGTGRDGTDARNTSWPRRERGLP